MPRIPAHDDFRPADLGGVPLVPEFGAAHRAADVPGNTSTGVELTPGATYYGEIETVGDHDWLKVDLAAGEYQIRVHGVGRTELNDPFLEVRDGNGTSLGTIDDYADGWGNGVNATDPYAVLTVAQAGTFFVDISSFVNGSTNDDTGSYIVTLVEGGNDAGLVHTIDEIAWQLTTNFQEFFGYAQGFAFDVGSDDTLTYNTSKLTPEAAALATAALASWSDVTGITFKKIAGAAELNFDDSEAGVNAYAAPNVSGNTILSSNVMITEGWINEFGSSYGSYSFETYIHEIGHALGLGHGANYNGTIDDPYYANDSVMYSIMSYSNVDNDEFTQGMDGNNPTIDASFRYMQTMAIADVVAIQYLYGAGTHTRTGNTTYGFNANTGNAALDHATDLGKDVFFLVYDDGGTDSLDFSKFKGNQSIDLHDEGHSDVLGGRKNVWIARDVSIENAFGGKGNDAIAGNEGKNSLLGGAGNDTLSAGDGDDKLFGGKGKDVITTGGGKDIVVVEKKGGLETVTDFANGRDKVDLSAFHFGAFADVKALASDDHGTLVLDLTKTTVELLDFALSSFDKGDVIL